MVLIDASAVTIERFVHYVISARARRLREEELLKSNASAAAWGTQFRSFVHELEGLLHEMDVPKDGVAQVRATVQRVLDDREEFTGGTAKPQLVARIAASHALADAPKQN